jgi:outer membrane protein OmpA-like peptidoglycan-associated protein
MSPIHWPCCCPKTQPSPAVEAQDVDVTRSVGFSIDTLEQARDGALGVDVGVEPTGAQPKNDSVGVDFFAAAQADLARNTQCIDDFRVLASRPRIYFPSGGLTGAQDRIGQARVLGLLAQQCPSVSIRVEGHSDPSGDPVINQWLSLERAQSIVTRVVASGIDASLFDAVGLSSAVPSLISGAESSACYDRRVEFSIVETAQLASFVAPTFGAAESQFQMAACVCQLQAEVQGASIEYAPRGMTVNESDMALASRLAGIAANCHKALLRLVGQHSDDPRAGEDGSTGRLRVVVLMSELVNAGFPSDQLILGAPSYANPIDGLSDSRVDFDVILEDL